MLCQNRGRGSTSWLSGALSVSDKEASWPANLICMQSCCLPHFLHSQNRSPWPEVRLPLSLYFSLIARSSESSRSGELVFLCAMVTQKAAPVFEISDSWWLLVQHVGAEFSKSLQASMQVYPVCDQASANKNHPAFNKIWLWPNKRSPHLFQESQDRACWVPASEKQRNDVNECLSGG